MKTSDRSGTDITSISYSIDEKIAIERVIELASNRDGDRTVLPKITTHIP